MMLVKSDEEEKALMESVKKGGLMRVLERCGIPRAWGEMAVDALNVVRGHMEMH